MKTRALLITLTGLTGLIFSAPAVSETPPPVPPSKAISLDNYKTRLDEESRFQAELESKMKDASQKMSSTQDKMVEIGKSVRANEKELQQIESRIDDLESDKSTLESSLQEQRSAIAKLVLALERIRRVPPQALIAKPDAPLKNAQSAMLLGDILPLIHEKAEGLKTDIEKQAGIVAELHEKKEVALLRSDALRKEYESLATLTQEREDLFKKTQQDYKAQEIEVQRVSQSAKNLKDLVKKLEEKRAQEEREAKARQKEMAAAAAQSKAPSPKSVPKPVRTAAIPPSGNSQLPVSGVIKTRYNDPDKYGAKSQGVRIEGRAGGLVVAPMGGVVRFAGPFKGYDNMVIIEHKDGYHSLVAGMESITAMVGQSIAAGEPLGTLKNSTNQGKPTVYYELRLNGNAVDPARKLTDLG